jgi:hypothetical protein
VAAGFTRAMIVLLLRDYFDYFVPK